MTALQILVVPGEDGPVLTLSGEADATSVEALNSALDAQLCGGTGQVTADLSGLSFSDSSAVRALLLAGRALRERGGDLVLLNPQPGVARILDLLGVGQLVTVHSGAGGPEVPR